MSKYKDNETVNTSNGFWYDISDGGYIIPSQILTDQTKAAKLEEAINLLVDWHKELEEDGKLIEF